MPKHKGDYQTWSHEEQDQSVLRALENGFPWVGFMPASALPQDDPSLPDDGREITPALMRLYKQGFVIRHRTRRYYVWGLPGSQPTNPIDHPGYFDSIEAHRDASKPQ